MMKRIILGLVALLAAVAAGAQVRPQNNHTVSTTLGANLEYGFEWAFAGQATVIGRIGMVSKDWILGSSFQDFRWGTSLLPGVTVEPRYYFLMNWRENHGKYTRGNSGEFIGVPVTAMLRKDAMGLGELVVSPQAGLRRAFATHWFHEFAVGADLMCLPQFYASPRLSYRIGYLF